MNESIAVLINHLVENLKEAGIDTEVSVEPIRDTKLWRIILVSDGFNFMSHSERQGLVWRLAEKAPSPANLNYVCSIQTLTSPESLEK